MNKMNKKKDYVIVELIDATTRFTRENSDHFERLARVFLNLNPSLLKDYINPPLLNDYIKKKKGFKIKVL